MEEKKTINKSIWGKWWTSFRKWFYPAWLVYETTIRFYEYSLSTYQYFLLQEQYFGSEISQLIAILASSLTFAICFFFLTVPASFALFKYFNTKKLAPNLLIEQKVKTYF
ncbi:hypothetical protein ACFQZW_02285 [Lutibacter aestuarii]|uniref:Uncharacterized protein n=1 Tax=Lutibacter aestuarii TaxID=861111 RepID=A0ABW2Z7Q8_9FLAO|nr:hypothetical protein [uncultured Lutibacter sp.]